MAEAEQETGKVQLSNKDLHAEIQELKTAVESLKLSHKEIADTVLDLVARLA